MHPVDEPEKRYLIHFTSVSLGMREWLEGMANRTECL